MAQELRAMELEEQREIRERIREEEKARKEFEKAMKDAEKEEQTLKKLIEKAEAQVSRANEEQKALFQQKLEELQGKLEAAEEKNQRAISMAQQTKTGNVYIISNVGSFGEDVYKIGMTRRLEPLDRVRELGDASVPFEFDVHAMIYSDDAPALERQLHKKFLKNQLNKINPRKEFFRLELNDLKNHIENMGINCKWTLLAEAKQYRETLKLEEEMKTNKSMEAEWKRFQEVTDPVIYDEVIEEV
ncbi:GIY-YIG nuclease family protein [Chryseobacterium luquanense]|uniref:GIY-YIG nuclease family protein n=1 Tax=Chryseobacterium luquanense TaxID=2983766 RepID=A0ABT3Y3J1_9FLAO|nr:GIY-YIG nuclease family protein [Chryseobacterium luquanense]MCX8532669.1 GIY-YIG nuclease family protein [Chryseobacterium luquanense]